MSSERDYFEEIRDASFSKAREEGLDIVIPSSRELQLDLDMPLEDKNNHVRGAIPVSRIIRRNSPRASKSLDRFLGMRAIPKWEAWRSKSGNCHVVLTLLSELSPLERVALQAMFGSDPMREMLNFSRITCGTDDPIALFRPHGGTANV